MESHTVTLAMGAVCQSKGRIEAFNIGSPYMNMIVIRAEIESGFVTKDDQGSIPLQSTRRLRMVQEDIGAPSEGATCAWMAANKAVGVHFLRCGGLLDHWSVEGLLSLVFM
ncbi:hypothetical protein TNCV_5029481 [Trichonephila clavipes]|nr:hypothetical protein TNCV_5029481 [Trichonephila clavipes]